MNKIEQDPKYPVVSHDEMLNEQSFVADCMNELQELGMLEPRGLERIPRVAADFELLMFDPVFTGDWQ